MTKKLKRTIVFLLILTTILIALEFLSKTLIIHYAISSTKALNIGIIIGFIEFLLIDITLYIATYGFRKQSTKNKNKNVEWNNDKIIVRALDKNKENKIKANIKSNKEFTKEQNKEIIDFCNRHLNIDINEQ